MLSIRQNSGSDGLPDFRNLGVIARVLIAVNLLAAAAAHIEPPLIASLLVLYAAAPWLLRLPYAVGCAAVVALAVALAWATHAALGQLAAGGLARTLVLAAALTIA